MSACILCKSNEINNLELGEMKVHGDLHVHYFCLLLSSGLLTNGGEDEGILGFLPSDIQKESRRAIRLKCHYCHQSGATIGCCISACNRSFHLNCGLKNNCLNQFTSEFKSYCNRHVEDSSAAGSCAPEFAPDRVCIICYGEMGRYDRIQSVFAPCCKSEWFHKQCLMKLADSAGYFFKCPKCNDVETFSDECMKRGIYVPQRDAAWETEENAFHELMERPNQCNATTCVCADGRDSDKPSNELLICETCGSNCIHKNCWQRNEPYYCCFPIDLKIIRATKSNRRGATNKNMERRSITSKSNMEILKDVRHKRTREHQTDDEKLDEKRKKRKTENLHENYSRRHQGRAKNRKRNTEDTSIDFPITKIRNGTFDQILKHRPRVLLYPLSVEQLDILSKSKKEKSMDTPSITDKPSIHNVNRPFAIISPTRKNGGKAFKNYTITSFFNVVQQKF